MKSKRDKAIGRLESAIRDLEIAIQVIKENEEPMKEVWDARNKITVACTYLKIGRNK